MLDEQTEDDRFYIGQMAIVPLTFGRYVPILSDKHAFIVNFPLMECSGSAAVLFAYIDINKHSQVLVKSTIATGLCCYLGISNGCLSTCWDVRMLSSCAPAMAVVVVEAAVLPPCPDDRFYIGQMAIVPMTFGRHVPILSDKCKVTVLNLNSSLGAYFHSYFPFVVDEMLAGSAAVLFAYIGFDAVASTDEEDDRFYIGQMGIVPMTFGRYVPILSDKVQKMENIMQKVGEDILLGLSYFMA
ncbi:cationic amino acid transporter 2, vacuolar-like [Senna tora]|uniref:Cationic amino acid transporter 2, vacuolar-like n=1 Tax=Senna tora TaxID=362788 RepID=A0A834SZ33_9FABA|nr:cationic amino acid transporter 2, vacuolar-like [Senna tora]